MTALKCSRAVSQTEIKENKDAHRLAKLHYERRATWRPELNHYHVLPEKVQPVENPFAWPRAFSLKKNSTLLCAPGVPRELKGWWIDLFSPVNYLRQKQRKNIYHSHSRNPEEQIFNQVPESEHSPLMVTSQVIPPTGIDIVISNINHSEDELENKISNFHEIAPINDYIWHLGNGHLEI